MANSPDDETRMPPMSFFVVSDNGPMPPTNEYMDTSNGWIEESEPEEDPDTIVDSPSPITTTHSKTYGAYYDGATIVPTAFPSMYPTGFYIDSTTGEHLPLPNRELPAPPQPTTHGNEIGMPPIGEYVEWLSDDYNIPTALDQNWSWISETLQTWRDEGDLPSITEIGESSSIPIGPPYLGETPHYSIPPIVSHVSRQDTRLELLEDAVNEMPGSEAIDHVEDGLERIYDRVGRLVDAFEHNAHILESVQEETIELRARMDAVKIRELEDKVRRIERRVDDFGDCFDQVEMYKRMIWEYEAFIVRGGHGPAPKPKE